MAKPKPSAPLMRPDEILELKRAAHFAKRSQKTLREWAESHGIARQSGPNGKLEFSAPAIQMVLQGRFDILERFRNGDRISPDIREYFDAYGIPGPELLPPDILKPAKSAATNCRRRAIPPPLAPCDPEPDQNQGAEMNARFDENGNDRSVALMLNGGNVLNSFRNELVLAASRRGMTVNEFTLRAVGRQLLESGSDLNGVFVPGDISEDI